MWFGVKHAPGTEAFGPAERTGDICPAIGVVVFGVLERAEARQPERVTVLIFSHLTASSAVAAAATRNEATVASATGTS